MANSQHVLSAALRPLPRASANGAPPPPHARLLVAGAAGVLGAAVLHRLVASGLFAHADVVTTEPMTMAVPRLSSFCVQPAGDLAHWPLHSADVAVVMFEPPRSFNDRERAFFTPTPEQLPALAAWLQRCGVRTLVVVLPHAPGRLPEALKRGLASLGEAEVAALGFERVLLLRSAATAGSNTPQTDTRALEKLARWMLSITAYMIAAREQPVRPERVAEFIEAALRVLPVGTFVASADLLHRASVAGSAGGARGASGASGASGVKGRAGVSMTEVVHDWLA